MLPSDSLSPDWDAPENVVALVTTRGGGVSEAPYAANNLALHVGDSLASVSSNRFELQRQLGANLSWQWLQQVHGNAVVEAVGGNDTPTADAVYTSVPGIACCVLTADCLPILVADKNGKEVAVAHAGWRGMAAGVIENTIRRLRAPAEELVAWLGPAIGPCHFEVGPEVLDSFIAGLDSEPARAAIARCFKPTGVEGKTMADLYALARYKLKHLGLAHISGGNYCTVCDEDLFYSYRRDGATGRMATVIFLKS